MIRKMGLEYNTSNNDAFSIGRVIFYDDTKPITRQRFSIAHEIGHIVLHDHDGATLFNRELSPNDDPLETEANIFASRLLAPLIVLHSLNVRSPEDIVRKCNISIIAATIRWERLFAIRQRDTEMYRKSGRGCFLLSHLERQVLNNFSNYIDRNKN